MDVFRHNGSGEMLCVCVELRSFGEATGVCRKPLFTDHQTFRWDMLGVPVDERATMCHTGT